MLERKYILIKCMQADTSFLPILGYFFQRMTEDYVEAALAMY